MTYKPTIFLLAVFFVIAHGNRQLSQIIEVINIGSGDYLGGEGVSDNDKFQFVDPQDNSAAAFANLTTGSAVIGPNNILEFTQGDQQISVGSNQTNVTTDSKVFGRGFVLSDNNESSLLISTTFQETATQAIGPFGFAGLKSDFQNQGALFNGSMALYGGSLTTAQVVTDDSVSFANARTTNNVTAEGSSSTVIQRGGTVSLVSNDVGQASCDGGSSGTIANGRTGAASDCIVQSIFIPWD